MNAILYAQLVLELLTTFAATAQKYAAVIQKARAEGRDISDAELAELKSERDTALANLEKKANG